ncbi:MAG: hypothetical protein AAB448_01615 [Patescibacteria group bacterium]
MNSSDSTITIEKGILGYRNYKSDKKEFFKEDFENSEMLQSLLNEMCIGESDITELGKDFLLEQFAKSDLAQKIVDIGGVVEDDLNTPNAIIERVRSQKPHEIAMLIHEARQKQADKGINSFTPKVEDAIKHATNNEDAIRRSKNVGCYYCLKVYPATEITPDDFMPIERTAMCPHCSIDAVLPDVSGFELDKDTLQKIHDRWFNE